MRIAFFVLSFFIISLSSYSEQKDTISIVTWNVYMRPRLVMHDNQIERAKEIVKAILEETYDVIVFEEIFDRKARKIIANGLSSLYKYTAGPGPKGLLRLNCGVMIFSKFPITENELVYYEDCKSADCIAKKAVLYTEIKISENKKFNLLGTHLQSIRGNVYEKIREKQLEIMQRLSHKKKKKNVPTIYAGDFNIADKDSLFQNMLSAFNAVQKETSGNLKVSSDGENTYRSGNPGGSHIDHVLLEHNDADILFESVEIVRKTYLNKNGILNDLSDHYAVKAKFIF